MYVLALRWYLPRSAPRYAEERAAVADRSQLLLESVQGRPTVHAYRLEDEHLAAIGVASARARDIRSACSRCSPASSGGSTGPSCIGLAAILVAGFLLVRAGDVTVGQTAAAAVLFHRLFNPIGMLLYTFDELQAAGASLARLVGVGVAGDRRSAGHGGPGRRRPGARRRSVSRTTARSGAARRRAADRTGGAGGPGRVHRRGEDHGRARSPPACCGPTTGGRWSAGCRWRDAAAQPGRDHQPGDARLRRPARRGPAPGPAGRHRRGADRGAVHGATRWTGSPPCRTACPRWSARADTP